MLNMQQDHVEKAQFLVILVCIVQNILKFGEQKQKTQNVTFFWKMDNEKTVSKKQNELWGWKSLVSMEFAKTASIFEILKKITWNLQNFGPTFQKCGKGPFSKQNFSRFK